MTHVRRSSVLEVRLGDHGATSLRATARDVVDIDLQLKVDGRGTLLSLEGLHPAGRGQEGLRGLEPLVGESARSGFRRRLGMLPRDTAELRLAHRVLDDLPILLQVAFQTTILDHPALARPALPMSLAGADQCEGWRSDGTMLTQIAQEGGVLQMALTPPVDDSTGPWAAADRSVLPAMGTRRRRLLEVTGDDRDLHVQAHFRDSYADPDGVERGLHGYTVTARIEGGVVTGVDASGVVLPWPECWRATDSTTRLLGLTLPEVEQLARTGLQGRGTCTHLNDTLRTLVDVAELSRAAAVG